MSRLSQEHPGSPVLDTRDQFERAIRYLDRKVSKLIRQYGLIAQGDRILVGVSGGKDSLALLHVLALRRRWRPERYELVACHVRQDHPPMPADPAVQVALEPAQDDLEDLLASECETLGVPFLSVAAEPIPAQELLRENVSRCLLCSRRRKKALFEAALAQGCRKVALGHHKNDAAETVLLNLLWQGRVEGIPPCREFFGGIVSIIRPLLLAEETELARICRLRGFPARSCSCAYADQSRRETAAEILALAQQAGARDAANNLLAVSLKMAARGAETPGHQEKGGNMPFNTLFIAHSPDADPALHRATIDTGLYRLTAVVVRDHGQALQVTKEMVEKEQVQSIVLCPGHSHEDVAEIAKTAGENVAVTVARGDSRSMRVALEAMQKAGWFAAQ
ncbi:MAG: DUF6506 family protein [Thermoleophilia bacterium]|nr:DUF6506 family protein [Thermoleophilia bacterium]